MTPSPKVRSERIPSAKRLRKEDMGSDGEEKAFELEEREKLDGVEIGEAEDFERKWAHFPWDNILNVLKRDIKLFAQRNRSDLKERVKALENQAAEKDSSIGHLEKLLLSSRKDLREREEKYEILKEEHSKLLRDLEVVKNNEAEANNKISSLTSTNETIQQEIQDFQISTKNELKTKQEQLGQIDYLKSTIQNLDQRIEKLTSRKNGLKENLEEANQLLKEKEKKISNLESLACDKDLQLMDYKQRCQESENLNLSSDNNDIKRNMLGSERLEDLKKVDSGWERSSPCDLILLGLNPFSTEQELRQHFEGKADVVQVRILLKVNST